MSTCVSCGKKDAMALCVACDAVVINDTIEEVETRASKAEARVKELEETVRYLQAVIAAMVTVPSPGLGPEGKVKP